MGLAVLIPLSAARTERLAGTGIQPDDALIGGFRLAFFGALSLLARRKTRKREN